MFDDFSGYDVGQWLDGDVVGNWEVQPSGNQRVEIVEREGRKCLRMTTVRARNRHETFSSLVTTLLDYDDAKAVSVDFTTRSQRRGGSMPHDWEVFWLLLNFKNVNRFYGVILKPDGWEFNKEWHDGERQRQDFLVATYNTPPVFPIGVKYRITVMGADGGYKVSVRRPSGGFIPRVDLGVVVDNGRRESGPAYRGGKIGLYCEDAVVDVHGVSITR